MPDDPCKKYPYLFSFLICEFRLSYDRGLAGSDDAIIADYLKNTEPRSVLRDAADIERWLLTRDVSASEIADWAWWQFSSPAETAERLEIIRQKIISQSSAVSDANPTVE